MARSVSVKTRLDRSDDVFTSSITFKGFEDSFQGLEALHRAGEISGSAVGDRNRLEVTPEIEEAAIGGPFTIEFREPNVLTGAFREKQPTAVATRKRDDADELTFRAVDSSGLGE